MSTTIEPALLRSRPLAEVVEIVSGFGFPKELQGKSSGDLPFFKVGDISSAWNSGQKKLIQAQHYLDRSEASVIKAKAFPSGTVVFAKIGEAIKLNRRAILGQPSIVDNNVMGLVPKEGVVDPNYLFYWTLMLRLGDISQATTVPSVRKSDVEQLAFPWLPIDQQKRIVAEIEKQFSRLDEAVANLKRVKANLKRYKAAVLKAAVEGRLVETEAELARREGRSYETGEQLLQRILETRRSQWQGKGKYKEPAAPDTTDLPELPEGWVWANVDQLADVGTGATPKRGQPLYYGGDIPWVTSSVVNHAFVDQASEYVTKEALAETNLTLYPTGTLLVAMYGEGKTRGKCAELRIPATTNQALAALQADERTKAFLKLFLDYNYEETRKVASGGVQPNLNLSLVRAIRVPFPPLAEQHRIITEVERHLSLIHQAEVQVDSNLQRADRLRQSTLENAFNPA